MKSGFFRKMMLYVVLTLVCALTIVSIAYTFTSRAAFAEMKAKELMPRAEYLASLVEQYRDGTITPKAFERLIGSDSSMWDARVYIYNEHAELMIRIKPGGTTVNEAAERLLQSQCARVLAGENITTVSQQNGMGIVIGVPVRQSDDAIIGAVFLTKDLLEVNAAMSGLMGALLISLGAAVLLMIFPIYMVSKSMSRPINQMTRAAEAMASGDFSVQAQVSGKDELAQLGRSLNFLSKSLYQTIDTLRLERNRLKNILDGLEEGIVAVDASGRVVQFNPASIRLLGGEEGVGLDNVPTFLQLWPHIAAVTESTRPCRLELPVGDMVLGISITPLLDDRDRISGTVTLLRDITEAQRLEQTRREYVANVSHELRTPIASIRGLADALNDGMVRKEDDRKRYYGYIVHESMRLSRLINDLLELSRLQSGKIALQRRRIDAVMLLHDVADSFEYTIQEHQLRFRPEIPAENWPVITNPDRVEQILVALLGNAIKYTDAGGEIVLRALCRGDKVQVEVRNTGHISEEHLPHIFERFYKANDMAHSTEGTGLGLAIVEEIIRLMGEKVWVKNEGDEVVFAFTMQRAEAEEIQA